MGEPTPRQQIGPETILLSRMSFLESVDADTEINAPRPMRVPELAGLY